MGCAPISSLVRMSLIMNSGEQCATLHSHLSYQEIVGLLGKITPLQIENFRGFFALTTDFAKVRSMEDGL